MAVLNIHVLAKDQLEAQGIRWVIESHITGVKLTAWESKEAFMDSLQLDTPDLVILDMDGWPQGDESFGEFLQKNKFRWLGISSERMFQTAYRGLRFRAEDVLFRPFSPGELIKRIQQIRFDIRNQERRSAAGQPVQLSEHAIDYSDFFLADHVHPNAVAMVAFLTPHANTLPLVYEALNRYPFTERNQIFALSDFILYVQETRKETLLKEELHTFLARWKERTGEPLAIVINSNSASGSLKDSYKQTKRLTEEIFFEGYDIILADHEQDEWRHLDPFLTPLEQREWIEMLEKGDSKAVREWVEHEFLTYARPYPDPEMVRIRLTSVLAQIRRYMKSYQIQTAEWENAYHEVFQYIVRKPVVYQIVQELIAFTTRMLMHSHEHIPEGPRSLVEKVKSMIESNYWDAQWNLSACAEALRMNKSTLSRRFAAESGQSFRETLHQVRMREAKRMLQETDLPLDEIARLTGYTHQTYFNAKFRQLEGRTPTAFRSGI